MVIGLLSGFVAATVGVVLHHYAVHGAPGNSAVIFGCPAFLLGDTLSFGYNQAILTGVNWLLYVLLFEGMVALRKKLSA
jgi:hypothetical protein